MSLELPIQAVQFVVTGLLGFYMWVENGRRASRDQLEALRRETTVAQDALRQQIEVRLDGCERFNETVKERLAHMPTRDDLHHVTSALLELKGEVRGSIGGMRHRVDSIHDRSVRIEAFVKETSTP